MVIQELGRAVKFSERGARARVGLIVVYTWGLNVDKIIRVDGALLMFKDPLEYQSHLAIVI